MSRCDPQTILIVDDEPALLHTMSALLQREGYRCIAAKNPTEALSMCESDEVIDFVVSDFSMPAMNGLQLWERIRQVRPGLHVLFVGRAETARIARLSHAAQQQSILIISEADGALESGSVINLLLSDGRVRFEIALDAAEKSRIKLSSRLLALAVNVRGGAP